MVKVIISRVLCAIDPLVRGPGLKARIARGSMWAFVGFGGNTTLRMVNSLILTRLLAPEIFGLMAILSSVIAGITLLSDVGVNASVIQNPRGEEPEFLRTAWTIQFLRGVILWGVSCLMAWPAAYLYDEPDLVWMLPVVGAALLITGAASTSNLLYIRRLRIGPVVCLELVTQAIGIGATIVLAYKWRNAWAIICGGLIGTVASTAGTYLYLKGGTVGFKLDRKIAGIILRFGRWVFVATMMTFLVGQGDRLILGGFMTPTTLGLYSLAALFSQLSMGVLHAVMQKAFMPAMVEVADRDRRELSEKINKIRLYILLGLLPPILIGAVFGQHIIEFFYDPRYLGAGWMLQVLSVGVVAQVIGLSMSPIFLSQGDSFRHMINLVSWAVILIASMLTGYGVSGEVGLVYGITLAPFAWLPVTSWLTRKYVDIDHRATLLAIVVSVLLIGAGWWWVGVHIP